MSNFFNSLFLPWLDVLALAWLAAGWAGYVWYTDHRVTTQPTLRRQMDKYVREWIVQMVGRDNRMLDVNIMRNLTRSSQFFASTTMLILGALVALADAAIPAIIGQVVGLLATQQPGTLWAESWPALAGMAGLAPAAVEVRLSAVYEAFARVHALAVPTVAVIDGAAQNPPPTPPQSTPRATPRPKRPAPDQGDLF